MFFLNNSILETTQHGAMGTVETRGKYPTYFIFDYALGRITHTGRRKHIIEMWNTRYNPHSYRFGYTF